MNNPFKNAEELFGERIEPYTPLDVKIEEPKENNFYKICTKSVSVDNFKEENNEARSFIFPPDYNLDLKRHAPSKFRVSGGKPKPLPIIEEMLGKSIEDLEKVLYESLDRYNTAIKNFTW